MALPARRKSGERPGFGRRGRSAARASARSLPPALLIALLAAAAWAPLALPAEEPAAAGEGMRLRGPDSLLLSGRVTFQAELQEPAAGAAEMVAFYLDGRLVHRATAPPWSAEIDLGPELGTHRIAAVAFGRDALRLASAELQTRGLAVAFRDRVELVVVPTTVLDERGVFRTDLQREDFQLFEDGEPQELAFFGREAVPARVALILDASKSMEGKMDEARAAARRLLDLLTPEDQVSILAFNDLLERRCPFTADRQVLERALAGIDPAGGTALYDALLGAMTALREVEGKRVAVLFTDGREARHVRPGEARRRRERVVEAAARENVGLYTIGLGKSVEGEILAELAAGTGGAYFHLEKPGELAAAYSRIFEELGSQYTLCYRPPATGSRGAAAGGKPAWRSIRVVVRRDEPLTVRHKQGYRPAE